MNNELAQAIDSLVEARLAEAEAKRGVSVRTEVEHAVHQVTLAQGRLEGALTALQQRPRGGYFLIDGALIPRHRVVGVRIDSGGNADPNAVLAFHFNAKVPLTEIKFSEDWKSRVWKKQGSEGLRLYDELKRGAFSPDR